MILGMIVILCVSILIGIPVAFSIAIATILFLLQTGLSLEVFTQHVSMGVNSFPLLAVPFFILAGNIMNTAGITQRIFQFVNCLVGSVRGGLAHVNILSSLLFAGMSGSATADAVGLGMIEIKAMKDAGYDSDFSAAVTAASATIGPIIPPSIIMVIYGVTAEVSIGRLFLGGIIPGILMALSLMGITQILAVRRMYPKEPRVPFETLLRNMVEALPAILTPVVVVGGIVAGIVTPTEASAIAVLYTLFLGFFVYKELDLKKFRELLLESMVTTASILIIIGAAQVFGWILTFYQVPEILAHFIVSFSSNPYVVSLLLVVMYLLLGCFMEPAAIVIMTVPVVVALLRTLGIDPVAFGVIIAMTMSIGTITPPLGIVMYIVCDIGQISIDQFIKAILPYLVVLIGVIVLLALIPGVITCIPDLVFKQ
ncbi:MAG: TRAP transporter large permease [Spirochaetales bacterium]